MCSLISSSVQIRTDPQRIRTKPCKTWVQTQIQIGVPSFEFSSPLDSTLQL